MGEKLMNARGKLRLNAIIKSIRAFIPNWVVNTFWHWPIAQLAAVLYGFPARNLILIGVTGTDGKTTTVYLINHILKKAGKKTVIISSVDAEIAGKKSPTGFHVTSPHPFQVQRYLKEAAGKGAEYAVLEVTSHALAQHRFAGCNFKIGVVTNIRPEHLDYHKSFKSYLKSKAQLLENAKIAVLNKDDGSYKELVKHLRFKKIIYSIKQKADITPETINFKKQPKKLPGDYNLSNILAAASVAFSLNIFKPQTFEDVLDTFQGVSGRYEEIETKRGFRVIVDFAHTPYALKGILQTVREQIKNKGRLFAVFGCAADRGKERRKMGKVSAKLADITIITAEDPRFEGVEKISKDIARWARRGRASELKIKDGSLRIKESKRGHYFIRIPDRQEAINFAISTARKDDIIVLCGKGHEKSMNFNGIEYPWNERKAVLKALKASLIKT